MKKILILILASIFLTGFFGGKYKKVKDNNGVIAIPINELKDGNAQFYKYTFKDKEIKFFIIRTNDGSIRTAFDACDVCYPAKKGYSQQGDFMICNNCGMRFHQSKIGIFKGGCNPSPLKSEIRAGNILITVQELSTHYNYF